MAKEAGISVKGQIKQCLGNDLFDVELGNGTIVRGHISGKLRKNKIRLIMGDFVQIELSPYDLTKGRIMWRDK